MKTAATRTYILIAQLIGIVFVTCRCNCTGCSTGNSHCNNAACNTEERR